MSTTLAMPEAELETTLEITLVEDLTEPSASEPEACAAEHPLIETYLRLIDGQNRRLVAYENAMQAERDQLAEIPAHITDLQNRLATEISPDLVDVLRAKLEEARADHAMMQRRVEEMEVTWPMRKAEMVADIARFEEKLSKIGYVPG